MEPAKTAELTPEQELESVKEEFTNLAIQEDHTPEDILKGWQAYGRIVTLEGQLAGKSRDAWWNEDNLLSAIEQKGGYAMPGVAQQALWRFDEETRFDEKYTNGVHTNDGPRVAHITVPFQRKNAQKFFERMHRTAQSAINNLVGGRHGN